MLASDVLPLLHRRVDDYPRRPEARRMAAPARERRRAALGSNQSEVVFLFDQWRNSSLASLHRLLDESHAIAGGQTARILFVFDHFEQLLESPREDANAQQFVEWWVRVLQEPGLNANFLVVLDAHAWPRLKNLGERIPGFDEMRAFELQGHSASGAEPGAVGFEASLRAKLSEVATLARPGRAVSGDFQASVDAVLLEVRRSARQRAAASLAKPPSSTAEALGKAHVVQALEAQRLAQAQRAADAEAARKVEAERAAEAEAARKVEAARAAEAEARRIAEEAAAAEAKRIAEELRRVEAERAAEAEAKRIAEEAAAARAKRIAEELRRVEAERAAEAEAKRIAEEAAAADARRIAEEQRVAQARRAAEAEAARAAQAQRLADAEAKRLADAVAADEARRIAEVADAVAAAKAKVIGEAIELAAKAAQSSEARGSAGYDSAPIASPSIAAARPGTLVRWAIKWGGATLAAMLVAALLVAALLWPSLRQRPDTPKNPSSPPAPTSMSSTQPPATAPSAVAPGPAPELSPALIPTAPPSATAQAASAAPVAGSGAPPAAIEPEVFTVWMNAGGSDARIASELARAIGGGAASARAVTAAAKVDPVESLRAPRSLAIAQYEALRAARRSASAPPLRVLTPLYAEEVVFIVRADSRLKFIHDLRGRRVNIGSPREGSSQTVREIYRQMFGTAMAQPSQLGRDAALAELVGFRSIDAMVLVDAQPSAWLASLHPTTARGLRLLRLDRKQPEDRRVLQAFQTSVLRAGPGLKRGEGMPTLATMSYLVASGKDDADAKQLADMVGALCRELPRLRAGGHPKWRELQPWVNQDSGWPVVAAGKSALKNCVSDRPAPAPAPAPTARRAPKSHSKH
jgi:TRAP-type uncharacterized transport system substrate-binding protein